MSEEEANTPPDLKKKAVDFLIVNAILLGGYSFFGELLFFSPLVLIPIFTGLMTGLSIFSFNKNIAQALGHVVLFFLILGIVGFSICMGSSI
jgi:hypothetical protein